MTNIEYRKSISEVLDILEHTNKEDVDKISPKFIEFLNKNKCDNYKPTLDHSKRIKEMNLRETTIGILSIINSKFWCTNEQKEEFNAILKKNELKYQEQIKEKYNSDNIFKNNKYNKSEEITEAKEKQLVEYKETFFIKFKKFIFKLLHIRF